MASSFIKTFLFINIISNIFLYINCEDFNITCEKMIINKNGIITNDTTKAKNNTMFSINYGESFIIYNCDNNKTNFNDNDCMFYYDYNNSKRSSLDSAPSPSSCMKRKTRNKDDNICCHYRKKKRIENSTEVISGCIELNRYEKERFKWNIPDSKYNKYNETNNYIIQFECKSELFKLNQYIFLIFFIIFFNF